MFSVARNNIGSRGRCVMGRRAADSATTTSVSSSSSSAPMTLLLGWDLNTNNSVTSITKRWISSRAARALLGLPTTKSPTTSSSSESSSSSSKDHPHLTLKELRRAYFAAAKKCHPDVINKKNSNHNNRGDRKDDRSDESPDFLQITRAYELLQGEIATQNSHQDAVDAITSSEEAEFRNACRTWLGVDAEIVEECKESPVFREWLIGRTDSAHHWRSFFLQHGGLAPKLRLRRGRDGGAAGGRLLATGDMPIHTTRRKRK